MRYSQRQRAELAIPKFIVTDVFGVPVTATFSTWDRHVVVNHTEMANRESLAIQAIESPDVVHAGNTTDSKVFYKHVASGFLKGQHVAVVVAYRQQKQSAVGYLNTAYSCGTPPTGRRVLWP